MLLTDKLQSLRLFYLATHLDQFIIQNKDQSFTIQKLLDRIADLELLERSNRSTQNRLKSAKIGRVKSMHEFDWSWPEEINRAAIEELLTVNFIRKKQNCVLAGPQGAGKTMIAKNIALAAINNGFHVVFTSASDLVIDLGSQESSPALQRRLKYYIRPNLLVIDELGYLSFDHRAGDLLFEIISKRYENGSTIVTTNLAFKDWGIPFQGAGSVTPLVDRLTHHCEIIKIVAESFRTKESFTAKNGANNEKSTKRPTGATKSKRPDDSAL